MSPKGRLSLSKQAEAEWESGRFKIMSALTVVSNLGVGIAVLLESDGDLQNIGAIVLVVMGAAHFFTLASGLALWRREKAKTKRQIHFNDREIPVAFKRYQYGYRIKSARKNLRKKLDTERGVLSVPTEMSASTWASSPEGKADPRDALIFVRTLSTDAAESQADLSKLAILFYAGLLIGLLGISLSAVGLGKNIYPAILAGSIIASIGFVTLACALVSAEDADEAT